MPGDLQDPTQLYPFHNNKVYEPGTNIFESGSPMLEVEKMIQNLAGASIGRRLTDFEMKKVVQALADRGYLSRPWGDQTVQDEVVKLVKSISMIKKVAQRWLTSTSS